MAAVQDALEVGWQRGPVSRLWATRRGTLPPEKAPAVHAEYGKAVQLEGQVIKLGMTGTSVAP